VVVRPTPTATIKVDNSSVCQNSTAPIITFTNPQVFPITITYNVNGGASLNINVDAKSSATVTQSTATVNTYTYNLVSIVYQTAPTCSSPVSGSVSVVVNPLPTITTTGVAVPKCFSSSTQSSALAYTAKTQSPTKYSIDWVSGPADVANAALPASPITIPIPSGLVAGTYTGTLTVRNANGCVSGNVDVSITIYALPTATLTSSDNGPVCANTTITYTTDAGQSNYVWTFSGTAGTDYILVSGGNSTSNTAVVTWLTAGTKTVTVNYTNGNGCTASTPTSESITINTGSVGGTLSTCTSLYMQRQQCDN
jgi:hypothetical protein